MKVSLFFILLVGILSCKQKTESPHILPEAVPAEHFDWLLGQWTRRGEKDGKQTSELWERKENNHYTGHGLTMRGVDSLWQENMQLLNRGQGWTLEITQSEQEKPTVFTIIDATDNSLVATDPSNEFPQQIIYHIDGDTLRAEISGGGPTIPFTFYK